ncbi:MAG: T9SS type A sorting domain-containing protein [Chitinophagales bacterium]
MNKDCIHLPAISQQPIGGIKTAGNSISLPLTTSTNITGYQWQRMGKTYQGLPVSLTKSITYPTAADTGFYKVLIQYPCGAVVSDSVKLRINVNTSVRQTLNNSISEIYPSPVNSTLHVLIRTKVNGMIDLSVMDITGRIVLRDNFETLKGNTERLINVSALAKGSYILRLEDISGAASAKFIVE